MTLKERFDQYIYYSLDGCHYWIGAISIYRDIRGHFSFKGRNNLAHRVAYEIYKGSVPDKLQVLHTCDNTICVNPDHLYIGTQKDNMRDMMRKGRHKSQFYK